MNTTSCSVPPRQPKMFSSTPSSRTSVTAWPISSRNSRWMVSTAYSPNSTWPPSGRWNNGSAPESDSDTSNAPSRGRLMTAIALMICRFELTDLSYHARPTPVPDGNYHFVTNVFEPKYQRSRDQGCGEHKGDVTAPAVLVLRDRRGGTS